MSFDVTVKRMGQDAPTHVLVECESIEAAVETARNILEV